MEKVPIMPTEKSIKSNISSFVELLKACAHRKDLREGAKLHTDILDRCLLGKSPYIASTLIHMYASCGQLEKAEEVLHQVPVPDVVSWSVLISAFAQQGKGHEALECFEKMQKEGIFPNEVTFICTLKACGNIGAPEKGEQIHHEIVRRGLLEKNVMLGNTLLVMYAKCGMLAKARQVFEELSDCNVISWSALIAAYAQEGDGYEALNCFYQMQREGIIANEVTFTCIMKACGTVGALDKGKQIHNEILCRGSLGENIVLGNALVSMYAKCGALREARRMFEGLCAQDAVSWNALIAGYNQHEKYHTALKCFAQMKKDGCLPDEITFSCILKACGHTGRMDIGKQIHNEIVDRGLLEKFTNLGTALVDMYANCGFLGTAESLRRRLSFQTIASWNALIEGYAQRGQSNEAMDCFEQMQRAGFCPDHATFISILKACGNVRAIEKGKRLHGELLQTGFLEKNIMVGTALIDMYVKGGMLGKAREVLEGLPVRDIVSWNALMAGYVQQEQGHEALDCFVALQTQGFCPNDVTLICALQACGSTKSVRTGVQIHEEIIGRDRLTKNRMLGTALVGMYAKCGALRRAQEVLENLVLRDVVSWNALIAGYAQHGKLHEALECISRMEKEGLHPDGVTFTSILGVCGSVGAVDEGGQIHDMVVSRGLLKGNAVLVAALVGMYAKCGMFARAERVLEELRVVDTVAWNALMVGYIRRGRCQEALSCWSLKMQKEGVSADEVTFTCIIKACGIMGAIDNGARIHQEAVDGGFLQKSIVLGTALVDMYARCGMIAKAQEVLVDLPKRNIASWNALIAGCGQQGQYKEALDCLRRMQWADGFRPNEITLLCVLNACGHSRQLDVAQTYYEEMSSKYGIIPYAQHHACIVAGLGIAGCFDEAMSVIRGSMPSSGCHAPMWLALLDACRKWGNVKVGRFAFEAAVELDRNLAAAYVLMCDIYVSAGMVEDADKIKAMQVKYAG